jgi:hypothetical protein
LRKVGEEEKKERERDSNKIRSELCGEFLLASNNKKSIEGEKGFFFSLQ